MSYNIKRTIKEYFTFTRGERTGIFVLLSVLFAVICFNFLLTKIVVNERNDFTRLKKSINDWEKMSQDSCKRNKSFFSFDPNLIDQEALDSLDFPDRIKENIIKYRKSGGSFRSVNDLKKIYGMNDSLFELIKSYAIITPEHKGLSIYSNQNKKNQYLEKREKNVRQEEKLYKLYSSVENGTKIELNSSDSMLLVSVNGIGPVLASRIIKYRKLLGGYYSPEQLSEVYGLSQENFKKINLLFKADTNKVKRMRLNYSEFNELVRHPYLNSAHANSILDFRTKNGPFKSLDNLLKYNIIDSVTFKKVHFYLTVD